MTFRLRKSASQEIWPNVVDGPHDLGGEGVLLYPIDKHKSSVNHIG